MRTAQDIKVTIAGGLIWFLQFLGLLIHSFAIPQISQSLANTFTEYSSSQVLIQVMMSSLLAVGQVVLAIIWLLMRRVNRNQLLEEQSSNWVSALSAGSFTLGALFASLMGWLISKNTLPPFLAIGLLIAIAVSCIVGLVSASLNGVLKQATQAQLELEGVI